DMPRPHWTRFADSLATWVLSDAPMDPAPSALVPQLDFFGNQVHFLTLQEPNRQLVITAKSDVEVTPAAPPEATPPWEAVRDRLRHDRSAEAFDAYQFAFESPHVLLDEALVA